VLTAACFRWRNVKQGFVLPAQNVSGYPVEWVYKLRDGVARHYSKPHRFVCITDEPQALQGVETLPLWPDLAELGGCYRRLKMFDPGMGLLGDRFVALDLDAVIVGSLDPLFDRSEDFVINAHAGKMPPQQLYNGSMVLMDRGARPQVWREFDPQQTPQKLRNDHRIVGTDQAWIRTILGDREARFTSADGVYDVRHSPGISRRLPDNARIVFFSGPRDPETEFNKVPWIREHWA
jgi:hypothetical protein